jgi:hypothetical protein
MIGEGFSMAKGRKGRTPDQIRSDRAEIAHLYLQRRTQAEIAEKLGLSRQQIGYDLNAIREEWLQSSVMDFNGRKAEELARLDRLEREYWNAWIESKKETQVSTTEQTTGGDNGDRLRAVVRKEQQTGNPQYLAGVQSCIEQRCKILGLNAPTVTQLTGPGGGPIPVSMEAVIRAEKASADQELEDWKNGRLGRRSLPFLPGDSQVPEVARVLP